MNKTLLTCSTLHLIEMYRLLGLTICLIVAACQEVEFIPAAGWSNPLNALSVSEADQSAAAGLNSEPLDLEFEESEGEVEVDAPVDGKALRERIIASLKPSFFGDLLDGSDLTDFGNELALLSEHNMKDAFVQDVRLLLTGQLEVHQHICNLAKRLLEHGVRSVHQSKAAKLEQLLKLVNLRLRRNQPLPLKVVEDIEQFFAQCVLGQDSDCGTWNHVSRFFALFPIGDLCIIVLGLVGLSVVFSKVLFALAFVGILGARMWRGGKPTFPKLSYFARKIKTPHATFVVFAAALHVALAFPPASIFSSVSFTCDLTSSTMFLQLDGLLLGSGALLIAICNRLRVFSR